MKIIDIVESKRWINSKTGADEAVDVMKRINSQHGMSTLGAIGMVAGIWAMVMLGAFVYYL